MHLLLALVPSVLLISLFGAAAYFGMSQHPERHKPAPRGRRVSDLTMRRHQEKAARQRKRHLLLQQFLVRKQQEKTTKEGTRLKRPDPRSR